MWLSGWKRHRIPYRGEPQPKLPKRRRQFRNLKRERREVAFTLLVMLLLTALVLGLIISNPDDGQTNKFAASIVVIIIASILTTTILHGVTSVNKFRKSYDVDISDEPEEDKDEQ